jgi:tryptophan synthase alpha chain
MANRIDIALADARSAGRVVLAPFVTVGYPDVDTSVAIAGAVLESGADMVELGVPFSDPLADGPIVQRASFHALKRGVTVRTCLDAVRRLRRDDVQAPLILMGYYNPFLHYGPAEFVKDASDAGADGFIVPDLPPEEASPFKDLCESHGLYLIPMLAPTSPDDRIERACQQARGFIYCVSVTGVTGARAQFRGGVSDLVGRIRRHTALPVLVGFGVSTSLHLREIGGFAEGALVGSALLDTVGRSPREAAAAEAARFVRSLRDPDS